MTARIWVITGTSAGFGLAIARYALSQGDQVIATVRSLGKFPAELKERGARPLVLDLDSSDEAIQTAAQEAIQIFGHVDVLVNNAASNLHGYGPIEEVTMQNIRRQFQSNLFGTIAFTQPFIAHFRSRRAGHVINISSVGATIPGPAWSVYCATKAALDAFTDVLASELKLFGVRVSLVLPGPFDTNIFSGHPAYAKDGEVPKTPHSTIYTDPVTQGYNSMYGIPHSSKLGDVEKLAVRIYEVGAGVGLVHRVVEGRPEMDWIRIPLGSESGEKLMWKYQDNMENVKAYEEIWRSADLNQQQ